MRWVYSVWEPTYIKDECLEKVNGRFSELNILVCVTFKQIPLKRLDSVSIQWCIFELSLAFLSPAVPREPDLECHKAGGLKNTLVLICDCFFSPWQVFWAIGTVFEVLLAVLVMPTLGWRWLLILSALPLLLFAVLCFVGILSKNPSTASLPDSVTRSKEIGTVLSSLLVSSLKHLKSWQKCCWFNRVLVKIFQWAVFMWLYLLEDNGGLEFCETKSGLEISPV